MLEFFCDSLPCLLGEDKAVYQFNKSQLPPCPSRHHNVFVHIQYVLFDLMYSICTRTAVLIFITHILAEQRVNSFFRHKPVQASYISLMYLSKSFSLYDRRGTGFSYLLFANNFHKQYVEVLYSRCCHVPG